MEKKIYWLVESNGDLSLTVASLATVKKLIESDFEGIPHEDVEEFQYTVTPVLMTPKEFKNMPEG